MADNFKPVLSICIPTYNRSGYLYFTLKSIVNQDFFKNTNQVQIVISDNCSSDLTPQIAKLFADEFPDKVKYSRNESNIGDRNFEKALLLGDGEVVRLHNDNFTMLDGSLKLIVDKINELRDEKPMFFFANGNSPLQKDSMCSNLNEFVEAASYLTTWIAAFSMWRDDLEVYKDFTRNVDLFLTQTDTVFNFSANGRKIFVYNEPIFEGQGVLKKGGYNIPKIFGKNYLSLLKPYLEEEKLNKGVYEKEKKRLLLEHIIPMKFTSSRREHGWAFKNDGYWRHLIGDYWYNSYFYTSIIKIARLMLDAELNLIWRKINPNSYQKYWRKRNRHNSTTITKNVDATKVFVGKRVSGKIDAVFTKNERELLIINDDVQISDGEKFEFTSEKELIII